MPADFKVVAKCMKEREVKETLVREGEGDRQWKESGMNRVSVEEVAFRYRIKQNLLSLW